MATLLVAATKATVSLNHFQEHLPMKPYTFLREWGNGKQAWKLAGKMTLYKQATKWMLPLNGVEGQLLTSIVSISTLPKFYYAIFYLNSNLYV